jgi:hypothetical protein
MGLLLAGPGIQRSAIRMPVEAHLLREGDREPIQMAAKIQMAHRGSIEVRPIKELRP